MEYGLRWIQQDELQKEEKLRPHQEIEPDKKYTAMNSLKNCEACREFLPLAPTYPYFYALIFLLGEYVFIVVALI